MDKFVVKNKRKSPDASESEKPTIKKSKEEVETVVEEEVAVDSSASKSFSSITDALNVASHKYKTPREFEEHFNNLSNFLLNDVTLMVNNKSHRLVEIEYYWTSDAHNDPFTHGDAVQATNANWYFHKTGKNYRGGSYKGLDITIGNSKEEVGGILIRTLENVDSGVFVCGPSLSVDHILKICDSDSINTLVEDQMKGNIGVQSKGPLYLKLQSLLPRRQVHRSARVGLHMTKKGIDNQLQKDYVFKQYRYFTEPKQVKKGRHYMVASFLHSGMSEDQIHKLLGGTMNTITKFSTAFKSGKGVDSDSFVGSKMSDDDTCKAFASLLDRYPH